ncbi:TPA: bacteriocin immunity protein [Bacillus anthracis]|nr:bacteriocin immunity protein [Bacillus anthracis]
MTKLVKEELLNEVYDLVLSVDIKDEERQALLTFKNAVEAGQDFDRAVMSLASDLRRIGVANIVKKTKMSASVNTFYQKIATYGEFEKNLGRGLMAMGVVGGGH